MAVSTDFDTLTLANEGIVLGMKKGSKIEISFSELDKIFIKVYKLNPILELSLILFPFFLLFFFVQYIATGTLIFVVFLAVFLIFLKVYKYKWFGLVVCSKTGAFYKKKMSLRFKEEYVTLVKAVKLEQTNYFIKAKQKQ